MMEEMAVRLKPYVTRYNALAAAAAPEDSAVLERLAAHERALLIFFLPCKPDALEKPTSTFPS